VVVKYLLPDKSRPPGGGQYSGGLSAGDMIPMDWRSILDTVIPYYQNSTGVRHCQYLLPDKLADSISALLKPNYICTYFEN
jgi:hypothetical protein